MPNFIYRICLLLTLLLSWEIYASNLDVKPKKIKLGDSYVRITKVNNEMVKFEDCIYGQEENSCRSLGNKEHYSIKELTSQRNVELLQAIAVVVVESAFLTVSGMWTYLYFGLGGDALIGLVMAVGGPVVGFGLPTIIDGINPIVQTKQILSLRNKIINDENVEVSNMEKFIDRLDLVLSKID